MAIGPVPPPVPPAALDKSEAGYPLLGFDFSGDPHAIDRLCAFAQTRAVSFVTSPSVDEATHVRLSGNHSATDPKLVAVINEALSGRLGKLRLAFVAGQRQK